NDLISRLGERQRTGEAGITRANDEHVGLGTPFEHRGCGRGHRGGEPERGLLFVPGTDGRAHEEHAPALLDQTDSWPASAGSTPAKRNSGGIWAAKSRNGWRPPPCTNCHAPA